MLASGTVNVKVKSIQRKVWVVRARVPKNIEDLTVHISFDRPHTWVKKAIMRKKAHNKQKLWGTSIKVSLHSKFGDLTTAPGSMPMQPMLKQRWCSDSLNWMRSELLYRSSVWSFWPSINTSAFLSISTYWIRLTLLTFPTYSPRQTLLRGPLRNRNLLLCKQKIRFYFYS